MHTFLTKDTPFAIALLALTLLVLKVVLSEGTWSQRPGAWLLLAGVTALVALFRQNGPLAAFGTLLLLLVCYPGCRRRLAGALALALVLWVGVRGPLYGWLAVRPS